MKRHCFIWIVFLAIGISSVAQATPPQRCPSTNCIERLVTVDDDYGTDEDRQLHDGNLRAVLTHACEEDGDDAIQFAFFTPIQLDNPITIRRSCRGRLFIYGRNIGRTVISGFNAAAPRDDAANCLIRIESDRNVVSRFDLIDYRSSSASDREAAPRIALCLIGNQNEVADSVFGVLDAGSKAAGNDVGVLIAGNENRFTGNHVSQNLLDGVQITGHANVLTDNHLGLPLPNCSFEQSAIVQQHPVPMSGAGDAALETPRAPASFEDVVPVAGCQLVLPKAVTAATDCPLVSNLRHGIHLMGDAHGNIIGGEGEEANLLQYNGGAGIRLSGSGASVANKLSPNQFNHNYGLGIDLAGEGLTENDAGDSDSGPNTVLNRPEILLVDVHDRFSQTGNVRATVYGKASSGTTVQLYEADGEEKDGLAEGLRFIQNIPVPAGKNIFSSDISVALGTVLVAIDVDKDSNTSEFSLFVVTELDSDADGIPDRVEDLNHNGVVDGNETDPFDPDSDGDGLTDAQEDTNTNGRQDNAETAGFESDSDGDGISDFVETHGDGRFEQDRGDTNPLAVDTDCDGLGDGLEDHNANGLVEWNLDETFPHLEDSDGDGVNDGRRHACVSQVNLDNCPLAVNPDQADADGDGFGDACDVSN